MTETNSGPLRECELLLQSLVPSSRSNKRRSDIMGFVEKVLEQGGQESGRFNLFLSGSFCSRTYLPASDIDLVLLTGDNVVNEMEYILSVFQSLCKEVSLRDGGNSVLSSVQSPMTIRNVEFINARTKLCHCLVNNVGIDVTINSVGALTTVLFIEEADRYLAKDHIFKRSLLLVKCWALNESRACVGQSLLGSKTGMLSSYALCVLVFRLFDQYPDLSHPLAVLLAFFHCYADADWENVVMTVQGPRQLTHSQRASGSIMMGEGGGIAVPARTGAGGANKSSLLGLFLEYFSREVDTLHKQVQESAGVDVHNSHQNAANSRQNANRGLALRSCNIQDPVDANNNLGYSVTRDNLELLQKALVMGRNHFQHLLQLHYRDSSLGCAELTRRINEEATSPSARLAQGGQQSSVPLDLPFVKSAFPVSFREYFLSLGTRVDMLDHPMQTWRQSQVGGIDPLAAPLSEQERSYVAGLHAAVTSRTSKKASGSSSACGTEDPLQGELQAMWSALRVELTRQATEPPIPAKAAPPLAAAAAAAAAAAEESASPAPVVVNAPVRSQDSAESSRPPLPAPIAKPPTSVAAPVQGQTHSLRPRDLSSPSDISRASSSGDSDVDNDEGASVSVSACSSPAPSSPCASSDPDSPLERGGVALHASSEGGGEGDVSPTQLAPEPEPEWSVEPVSRADSARSLSLPSSDSGAPLGGKKAKRKKRRGSSSANQAGTQNVPISTDVTSGSRTSSPVGSSSSPSSPAEREEGVDRVEATNRSLSELGLVLKGLHRSYSLQTLVAVLAAIAGAVLLYYSGHRSGISQWQQQQQQQQQQQSQQVQQAQQVQPMKGVLSPSLSGAEVLPSLDISLSAVSGINSVAFGESNIGSSSASGRRDKKGSTPIITSSSSSTSSTSSASTISTTTSTMTAAHTVVVATYWVNAGTAISLGPPKPECPLHGLGAAIREMVAASGLDKDIEVSSGLGLDECPVVVPAPQFQWRKDGVDLSSDQAQSSFYSTDRADSTTAGEYSCVALLGVRSDSSLSSLSSGDLNIAVSGRIDSQTAPTRPLEIELVRGSVQLSTPPQITKMKKSKFFDLAENQPLYLDVQAEGSPPPAYQWYLNGVALAGEDRKTLNIGSIQKEHAGAYTCEVSNMAGSVTFMDITVSVRSSPVPEPTKSAPQERSKAPTPKRKTKQKKPATTRTTI